MNKIKAYERVTQIGSYFLFEEFQDDHNNMVFKGKTLEVELPTGFELLKNEDEQPHIYKNGYAYKFAQHKNGYLIYPAISTLHDAIENKRIITVKAREI